LGDGVIDAVRVQPQSVGRRLADGDPVAGPKVASSASGDEPESLVVFVEDLGDGLGAVAGNAAGGLVSAFRG
jgi:hypothetical protein